jgi:hypothetical protein
VVCGGRQWLGVWDDIRVHFWNIYYLKIYQNNNILHVR